MFRAENIEMEWHAVGGACKMYALAYGVGFLALAILNRSPDFEHIAQISPWSRCPMAPTGLRSATKQR
jgi:hypothetical protein